MESVRINRFLAMCGLGSRRTCEQLVTSGRVAVNGAVITSLGHRVLPSDKVIVDGEPAKPERELVVLLNKPRNILCTRADPMGRDTIYDLLPRELQSLAHVGRLDRESEGMLVLTNTGTLTYTLTHPSSKVEKEYLVQIDRAFHARDRQKMLDGIQTEEGMAFAVAVEAMKPRLLRIILQQGIKRQIRLMLAELGYEVKELVRTRIGSLEDTKLRPGKWRRLSEKEIALLQINPGKPGAASKLPPPPTVRSRRPAATSHGGRHSPGGIGDRPVTSARTRKAGPASQKGRHAYCRWQIHRSQIPGCQIHRRQTFRPEAPGRRTEKKRPSRQPRAEARTTAREMMLGIGAGSCHDGIMTDNGALLQSLGVALGLGLLVGLQREWEHNRIAGLRTFAFVSLFGALSGILARAHGGWVLGAALVAFAVVTVPGYVASLRDKDADPGLTTEIAMLVMFATGALAALGYRVIAVVVAGSVMVLLQSKKPLHQMVQRIGEDDLRAIARLVLIGLVILPLLPNKAYGYNGVLNPFSIWLMVVLIVGISLAAYLAGKFLGPSKGAVVAGVLGGLISSTATTASLARRSKEARGNVPVMAVIALISAAIVFGRVVVEILIVGPRVAAAMLPPLLAVLALAVLVAVVVHRLKLGGQPQAFDEAPPSGMKGAVMFALLYVAVLFAVSYAKGHFGQAGLFTVAAISGLTDMDAITLSTATLANAGHLESGTAWRIILTGGLANVLFKAVLVAAMGAGSFIKPVLAGFAAMFAGGAAILAFWPG